MFKQVYRVWKSCVGAQFICLKRDFQGLGGFAGVVLSFEVAGNQVQGHLGLEFRVWVYAGVEGIREESNLASRLLSFSFMGGFGLRRVVLPGSWVVGFILGLH